jgi:hypothetical protein
MSRICLKGLPKSAGEAELRKLVGATFPDITDIKIARTRCVARSWRADIWLHFGRRRGTSPVVPANTTEGLDAAPCKAAPDSLLE